MNRTARTDRRRVFSAVALGSVALLALGACAGKHATGSSGSTTTLSLTSQAACDAATKDGGGLNYWTSTDPEIFKQELAPFNAKYPNIKVNYTSLRPADQVQRIVAEVQAHHPLDVDAIAGDLPSFAPLFDQKLIQPVDWTKLGEPADVQFALKGYTTIRTYREVLGLGYNTTKVQGSDLPNTWAELVNS
ncbi:MAG: arabinogalactan oligomer / maltooligosaccharide transport system substrate-binding protein, partial [Pseudonocardiales bacterium]|nr:arabinogalactan oligomer / maltooligosaccharide transport system substrate-binding protein [Pseudonocardiales bacterium]